MGYPTSSTPPSSRHTPPSRGLPSVPGYDLLEKIGHGAMGTVYRARQVSLGRIVAVKILHRRFVTEPRYTQRFLREGRFAGRIDHPSLISVFDVGHLRNTWYLVMEYVPGRTVAETVREGGAMPEARVLEIAEKVADALGQAHRRGILHRDVKPSNIILADNRGVKLTDLGLAKPLVGEDPCASDPGQAVGTPAYMAPEQCLGHHEPDQRADIYALGATLYHMLAGVQPFKGRTDRETFHMHLQAPLPPLRSKNEGVSPATCALVEKMMAKEPSRRFRSMAEVAQAIAALRARPRRPRRPLRSKRLLAALGLALAVAAAVVLAVFLGRAFTRGRAHALLDEARAALHASDHARALAILGRVQRTWPRSAASQAASSIAARVQRDRRAMQVFREADAAARAGQYLGAAQALELVCSRFADTRWGPSAAQRFNEVRGAGYVAAVERARSLAKEDKWDEAAAAFDVAVKLKPEDPVARTERTRAQFEALRAEARFLARAGELDHAREKLRAALRIKHDPAAVQELRALGDAMSRDARLRALIAHLRAQEGHVQWDGPEMTALSPIAPLARQALRDPRSLDLTPAVSVQLLVGLHFVGDDRALPALVELVDPRTVKAPDPLVLNQAEVAQARVHADKALVAFAPRLTAALMEAFPRSDEPTRKRILDVLEKAGASVVLAAAREAARLDDPAGSACFDVLTRIGAPALPALIDLLANARDPVRNRASAALCALAADVDVRRRMVPLLVRAIGDFHYQHRTAVIRCLAAIGPAAIPLLADQVGALSQDARATKDRAIASGVSDAARLMGREAVPPLVAALSGANPAARRGAAVLLPRFGKDAAVALVRAVSRARSVPGALDVLAAIGEPAVPTLLEAFRSSSQRQVAIAAEAFARMGRPGIPHLVPLARGRSPILRSRALHVLSRMGAEAVPALLSVYAEGVLRARPDTVKAMVAIGPAAVPNLVRGLSQKSSRIRVGAIIALARLEARSARFEIVRALRDRMGAVRAAAARAVGLLGDADDVTRLADLLSDKDRDVRLAAVDAVARLGGPRAGQTLVRAMSDKSRRVRERADEALVSMGEEAVPALDAALSSKDRDLRERVVAIIGKIGGERAIALLIIALRDEYSDVREASARTLGDMKAGGAAASLGRSLYDPHTRVRVAAAEALGKIRGQEAEDALVGALKMNQRLVRIAAAKALGEFHTRKARSALSDAAQNDPDAAVRAAAKNALGRGLLLR